MSIAHIVITVEETDKENYQVRMVYSGGNDLDSEKAKAAFEKAIRAVTEALDKS